MSLATLTLIPLIAGALSFGPALDTVLINRQTKPLLYTLPSDFNYPCIVGVPAEFHWLTGREVYFITETNEVHGPWGVVDYEAPQHAGQMHERQLVADLLCARDGEAKSELVHTHGHLAIKSSRR